MKLILIVTPMCLSAQMKNYIFEDGTTVKMEVISVDPDEARKLSIYAGGFGPEGVHGFGLSYYSPTKALVDIAAGPIWCLSC